MNGGQHCWNAFHNLLVERLTLPPGYGRVAGVEIGERLPVGSDAFIVLLF